LYNNNYFSEKAEFRGKRRKKAEKEGTLKNSPSEKRKNSAGAISFLRCKQIFHWAQRQGLVQGQGPALKMLCIFMCQKRFALLGTM